MRKGPAESRSTRRATSYDVARRAGVSQSAVSRCFAVGGSIAPSTRDRVLKAATELGFRPNALAQGLISGRSGLVAVIISSLTNLYYPEVLAELSRNLTARDMRVLLFALTAESEVDTILDQVWRHSVDGVISAARLDDGQVRLFADHGIPLVLYNRASSAGATSSVSCDSATGERELVTGLLAAGHKRFGIVAGPADSTVGEDRYTAATRCLAEAGIADVAVERGDYSYASGRRAMLALKKRGRVDAVVCVSDIMAIGAIDAARFDLSLDVPGDVSIVGFDGSGPASWASYDVTSIRQPVRRMTEAAVAMLLERIDDPDLPAERRAFTGDFVPGGSAKIAER